MRQRPNPSLFQLMAWRRTGAKPLSELMLEYFNWIPRNKLQWHFNQNSCIFIQENPFENVVLKNPAIFLGLSVFKFYQFDLQIESLGTIQTSAKSQHSLICLQFQPHIRKYHTHAPTLTWYSPIIDGMPGYTSCLMYAHWLSSLSL